MLAKKIIIVLFSVLLAVVLMTSSASARPAPDRAWNQLHLPGPTDGWRRTRQRHV